MKCIIMANGEYGSLDLYREIFNDTELVLCADGGANYAWQLGIMPSYILGDMDSILPEIREYFQEHKVLFKRYPERKDFTDTQLALERAEEAGADEIIFTGTLGKRLDHTLSNLYAGIDTVKRGKKVIHFTPECIVYLVTSQLELHGKPGELVSILPLSDKARGVWATGVEYVLKDAELEKANPYAISNVIAAPDARISVSEGVLAVFHYLGNE
ncbi:MAG: thiamine diphosphokinase [Syntrophomonadaceae bacterium]|nr:thiamine diphosphokinase [Syntrophomonadaceae bacterium]